MYLRPTQTYYRGTESATKAAPFLLLLQLRSEPCSAENTYAVVRKVALRQLGHFMMGNARLHGRGKWESVSGAYGNDGLPMTVDHLPKDAVLLPVDLYAAWNKGGGWNGAGSEADAMRRWAIETFLKLAVGDVVSYSSYGQSRRATITRLSEGGSIVFLDNGRWIHAISAKRVSRKGQANA